MPRPDRAGIVALCLAGLAVNAFTLGPSLGCTARGLTDFMPLYAGGKLVFTGDLYSPARNLETEARTEGWSSPTRLFVRLPCFALFFWPLAQLPYLVASAVWEILCVTGLIGFALLWPAGRRWHNALACCWSLPLWMTVAEGQDVVLVLLCIAIAAVLVGRNRSLSGGVVASLCLAKFHLFLTIPVWIWAGKRWRFASGLLAGSAVLIAGSFAAGGRNWPLHYYALLRAPATNPYGDLMPNLHGLFAGFPHAGAAEIAGAATVAMAVWVASRGPRPEWGFAAALAGGILVAPHAYMADGALLIPVLLPLNGRATNAWTQALRLYLLSPIPWVLLLTGNGFSTRCAICALVVTLGWPAPFSSAQSASRAASVPGRHWESEFPR